MKNARVLKYLFIWILTAIFFVCLSYYNFLLFHSLLELFCIVISFSFCIIAYNSFLVSRRHMFTSLGISYFFVGATNALHMLAFKGVGVFGNDTANLGTLFVIVSKFIEGISLLILPFVLQQRNSRRFKPSIVFGIYSSILIIILVFIFNLDAIPLLHTHNLIPTSMKTINELLIALILIVVFICFTKTKTIHSTEAYSMISLALATKAASQIFFVLYSGFYDIFSVAGHILRFVSFFYTYKALVATSLSTPLRLLADRMKKMNMDLIEKNYELAAVNSQLKQEADERKRMVEVLRQSEQNLRELLEMLPEGVAVVKDNKFIYANRTLVSMLKAARTEDLIDSSIYDFVNQQESYNYLFDSFGYAKTLDGKAVPFKEQKLTLSDGTLLDVEMAAIPIFEVAENAVLYVLRDISEHKRIEVLKKSYDESRRMLGEAVEQEKLRTDFFANLSHELRTPINLLLATLQLFDLYKRNNKELNPNSVYRHMDIMRQNCRRLLRLVNNLIDATKIDAGYYQKCLQNGDIVNVIKDITLSVKVIVESKGLKLRFDTDIDELKMVFDADMMERIMLNLLSNAIKFSKPGGEISVLVKDKGKDVEISVHDNGIGIPEDKLEAIFTRFSQADRSLEKRREGSGIGLSLVKSLIEIHGGSISVKSRYGEGCEFIILLPVENYDNTGLPEDEYLSSGRTQQDRVERIRLEFSDIYQENE